MLSESLRLRAAVLAASAEHEQGCGERSLACQALLHLSQLRLDLHVDGVIGHRQQPEQKVGGDGQHQPASGRAERCFYSPVCGDGL